MVDETRGSIGKSFRGSDWMSRRRLAPALILAAVFSAYAGTSRFGFVFDDRSQVVENRFVQSWKFLPRYFKGHVWSYQRPHMLGNYYRPVFLIWLRTNHAVFGLQASNWHLASVASHLLVTLMVYLLARKMVSEEYLAAAAAVTFGLHPVHIEAVAYVSGVSELLVALFVIPSFLCYSRYREAVDERRGRPARWLAGSLLLYALATLTKETAVVLNLLLLAYEWIEPAGQSLRRRAAAAARNTAPYFAVTLCYLLVRWVALKGLSHAVTPLPFSAMVMTYPALLVFYLKLLVWPVGLSPYYDLPYVTRLGLTNFVLPIAVVLAVAAGLWMWCRRTWSSPLGDAKNAEGRAVALASVWLVAPILPTLNMRVLPAGEIAHDRYLYLPSVGFSIIVALALKHIPARGARLFREPAAQAVSVLGLAVALGIATAGQSSYWADELSLYYRSHRIAPHNVSATTSLGAVAAQRGLYAAAMRLYKEALARNPNFWQANVNMGYLDFRLGNLEEASRFFIRSVQIDPTDADQYVYLGLTCMGLGRLDEAEAAMRRALIVWPEGPGYHLALGRVLRAEGQLAAALQEFNQELRNDPGNDAARAEAVEVQRLLHSAAPGPGPQATTH